MNEFEYPIAVGRERYFTIIGGRSRLLEKGQVGLHARALMANTRLSPGDSVLISATDRSWGKTGQVSRPLYMRSPYRVKPITDFHDTRLLAMSSDGEAILPKDDPIGLGYDDEIILNAAVRRLPKDWVSLIIRSHVKGRESQDAN